jgi:hypothetical protein
MTQFVLTVRAQFGLQVDEFTAWLNPKGNRELALRNTLTKWWPHIVPGMRKRLSVRRFYVQISGVELNLKPGFEQYRETSRSSSEYTCQTRQHDRFLTSTVHDMDKPQSSEHVVALSE